MGRVAGSYGVRGWLKVAPEDGAEESLAGAKEWWIGAEAYAVSGARIPFATFSTAMRPLALMPGRMRASLSLICTAISKFLVNGQEE